LPPQIKLVTTGRRSGQPRTVTLYAYDDGDSLVVVGSNGGKKHHPGWAHNLRAHPTATVMRGRLEEKVTAHEPRGKNRDRLWELVCERFPLYVTYQKRTERTIPLFILKPK
jgi:deazaflavin-dependent oxidoreductase (nitroreductase family)